MIVDFHIHLFSEALCSERSKYLIDGQFNRIYNNPKAKITDLDHALPALQEAGVDYAVAMGFPWEREDFCAEQNEYLGAAIKRSGGTILSFASVPLCCKAGIDSWVRGIKDRGFSGIGEIGFYRDGITPGTLDFLKQILGAARKYSLPVCLHVNEPVGHQYAGKYDPGFNLLYPAIAGNTDVTIILSHWGGGLLFYELMQEVSAALTKCYYDTAASPLIYSEAVYAVARGLVGSKKILFGSDYPLLNYSRYFDHIHNAFTDTEPKDDILWKNACGLLNIR